MILEDFIDEVFLKFPPRTNDLKPIELWYSEYRTALTTGKVYDYRNAIDDFQKNYKYSTLPTTNTLLCYLEKHVTSRGAGALEHIQEIKKTPRFNIDAESDEFKNKIKAKLAAMGIKSKLQALQ